MDKVRRSEILGYAKNAISNDIEMAITNDAIIRNLLAMLIELLCDMQVNINYSPTINTLDSEAVQKFMKGLGREALEKMLRANVGGFASAVKREIEKY